MGSGGDGYYYKYNQNPTRTFGPIERAEFDRLYRLGALNDAKVWRQSMGFAYKIKIERKFKASKVLSCEACSHICELVMIIFSGTATATAFFLVDFSHESQGALIIVGMFSLITVGMVLMTIRTLYKRWKKSSTEQFVSEV
jgi:hypothetical protein